MRAFSFDRLGRDEFDAFCARHPQGNFQQTSAMGDLRERQGEQVVRVGVREGGELVAAAQVGIMHSRLSTFAEIHDGPLCDLHDRELTEFLFEQVKAMVRKEGAAQLVITPEQVYRVRDASGAQLSRDDEGAWPADVPADASPDGDQQSFDTLLACKFEHDGFDRTYNAIPRWRFVKDLRGIANEEELLATYTRKKRRDIGIARGSFVTVESIGREALPIYHGVCELSCEKQGFDNRPLSYFEALYDCLGDAAEFKVAYLDLCAYRDSCASKRDALAAEVRELEERMAKLAEQGRGSAKVERRLRDAREKHEGALGRLEEADSLLARDGERVPVAAALFVWHPRECVYLFSGSNEAYTKFCGSNAIQHQMMLECMERGVKRYNFYGINGIFDDPSDPGHGLLQFKQGFGGYVEELMGSFTLPTKPLTYALKRLGHKVLRR